MNSKDTLLNQEHSIGLPIDFTETVMIEADTLDQFTQQADRLIAEVSPEEFISLHLDALGYRYEQSADLQSTVANMIGKYLKQAREKLDAKTRAQAIATSLQIGLLPNPAKQDFDDSPKDVELTMEQINLLRLVMSGLTRVQIAKQMNIDAKTYENLSRKLKAGSIQQAVWSSFQIETFKPIIDRDELFPSHLQKIQEIEQFIGSGLIPRGRSPSLVESRERRRKNYEDFMLMLLSQKNFAIYQNNVGKYVREKYGYNPTQWRNYISKLGTERTRRGLSPLVSLAQEPNSLSAHGVFINTEALIDDPDDPHITPKLIDHYRQRLQETGITSTEQLNTLRWQAEKRLLAPKVEDRTLLQMYSKLDDRQKAALSPVLITAVNLLLPGIKISFSDKAELIQALVDHNGLKPEEIGQAIGALANHKLLDFDTVEDGSFRLDLNNYGKQILKNGILKAVRESRSSHQEAEAIRLKPAN
jgi:DNA-binding CsgD family transcriptional regulator